MRLSNIGLARAIVRDLLENFYSFYESEGWIESISLSLPIIAIVGSRQSGKTTTVETIIRGLAKKGYRVATAKHIHESDFSIDTEGKDTWRHAEAGARTILSLAPNEITIIRKVTTQKYDLGDIVKNVDEEEIDLLVLEGFRGLVAKDLSVPKIVTIKNANEAYETSKHFKPILAFEAPAQLRASGLKVLRIDALKEPEKLTEIVNRRIGPIIQKRRARRENLEIRVGKRTLTLNPFVHKFVRNVVLSMVASLKETEVNGNENLVIEIRKTDNNQ